MVTYLQVTSKILSIINKPFNLEVAARIVDSFKSLSAVYLRRQVATYGIDSKFKLTYEIELITPTIPLNQTWLGKPKVSSNRIFPSINMQHSAPLIDVFTLDGVNVRHVPTKLILGRSHKFYGNLAYTLINQKLVLFDYVNGATPSIDKVLITSIFEDPADILLGNSWNLDDLEVVIPFPIDMIESITADILKTEFGIMPTPNDVEISKPVNQQHRR